jgi:hypothetical protein
MDGPSPSPAIGLRRSDIDRNRPGDIACAGRQHSLTRQSPAPLSGWFAQARLTRGGVLRYPMSMASRLSAIALELTHEDRNAVAAATAGCAKAAHDRLRRGRIARAGVELDVLRRTQDRGRARRTRRHSGRRPFHHFGRIAASGLSAREGRAVARPSLVSMQRTRSPRHRSRPARA